MMSATGHESHSGATGAAAGDTQMTANAGYRPIDEMVADDFFKWPRHQPESLESPRLVGLLYGLLCVDISGKEVLLPNSDGIADADGHHAHIPHQARIWFKASTVTGSGQASSDPMGQYSTMAYRFVDIAKSSVVFKAFNDTVELEDRAAELTVRNNDRHPWMDFKWVRCLYKLTGFSLIDISERNDPAKVRTRIRLETGTVAAVPPFSKDGQHNEWRVTQLSDNTEVVSATTDSMLWSRPLPDGTTKVRMTLTPLDGGAETHYWLVPEKGAVLCVATHATTDISDPTRLTHTAAFAKILDRGGPSIFPIPELVGLKRPYGAQSSDEVHCECASCP